MAPLGRLAGSVPVFRAVAPAPYRAGLVFRVGVVDEALPRRGITHLVEHLTLAALGEDEYPYNGWVGPSLTTFMAKGSVSEIQSFLQGVAAALRAGQFSRVELEKQILLTEAAGRSPSPTGELLFWRYGARGFGLTAMAELGLHGLDGDDAGAWARERFSLGNAAMWVAGPDPISVSLELDADGQRWAVPEPTPGDESLPGWAASPLQTVQVGLVGPRSAAFLLGTDLLADVARKRLRADAAISYTVESDYQPLTGHLAHCSLVADTLGEHAQRVIDIVMETLDDLASGNVEREDFERVRRRRARDDDAFVHLRAAATSAADELLGGPQLSPEDFAAALETETFENMLSALEHARTEAFALVPVGPTVRAEGFVPSRPQAVEVTGPEVLPAEPLGGKASSVRLVLGDQGVMMRDDSQALTVTFDRCAAVGRWANGVCDLYGQDGSILRIAPFDWQLTASVDEYLRSHLPPHLWVQLRGDPDYAGHDPAVESGRQRELRRKRRRDQALAVFGIAALVTIVIVGAIAIHSPSPILIFLIMLWVYRRRS